MHVHGTHAQVTPGWLDPSVAPGPGGPWPCGARNSSRGSSRTGSSRTSTSTSTSTSSTTTSTSAAAGTTELLLATPDWLYCLVGRWAITAGWPSLKPRALCAVLHLVESRAQVTRTPNPNPEPEP